MDAATKLLGLLDAAVKKDCAGREKVGLIYSAGVDSTLVGVLASKYCEVAGFNVGMAGARDPEYSRESERALPFEIIHVELTLEKVEEVLPAILKIVGEPNPVKVSVGVPFYWASKAAAEAGLNAVLCGQGADELFGGYNRYVDHLSRIGYEGLEALMDEDVTNIWANQLNFDKQICALNGVEIAFPYMDGEFSKAAGNVPIEEKISRAGDDPPFACVDETEGGDFIRKFVLREMAAAAGVPKSIIERPKKAAQYGSGSDKAVRAISKNRGFVQRAADAGRTDFTRMYLEDLIQRVNR